VIIAVALLLRVINLDSDPSALISRDFITDEGWWAHNARNAVFHGQWRIDDYNLGLYSAYLYNWLLYFAFTVVGVDFTALRIASALAGWLTVVLTFLIVRREIGARAGLIACALLGFSNLHILYSRSGFTESVMVFFLALTLWLWSHRRTHYFFALIAGISLVLMVVTKITAIYFVPGLALAGIAAAIRQSVSRREALFLLCGIALAGAVYVLFYLTPNFGDWLHFNRSNGSGNEWVSKASELIGSIPRLLAAPFYAETPLITGLTLLALGLLVIGASRHGLAKTIRDAGELEITVAMLLIGYLFVLALMHYQPERRFVPALFLMLVLSASVLEKGWASLEKIDKPNYRMSALGWFAALFLLPALGILEVRWRVLGPPFSAVAWLTKVIMIVGLIAVAVALSRGRWPRWKRNLLVASRLIFVLLFSFLSLGLIYKALSLWGLDAESWSSAVAPDRSGVLAVAAAILTCVVVSFKLLRDGGRAMLLLLGTFLFIEGIQISTWLLQPTYTLKEANTSLASILKPDETIVSDYETILLSSPAKVICRSVRRGFNVDVFEKSDPKYILVLRRDNWWDSAPDEFSEEQWPRPAGLFLSETIATFDLCPVRSRGPRFIAELYGVGHRMKRNKKAGSNDSN
jgi:4-amino-4-deoxy-L-arabinose transferase-like glycosyltransferase